VEPSTPISTARQNRAEEGSDVRLYIDPSEGRRDLKGELIRWSSRPRAVHKYTVLQRVLHAEGDGPNARRRVLQRASETKSLEVVLPWRPRNTAVHSREIRCRLLSSETRTECRDRSGRWHLRSARNCCTTTECGVRGRRPEPRSALEYAMRYPRSMFHLLAVGCQRPQP
jgi:hypothetical protein